MYIVNEDKSIYVTRGDALVLYVGANNNGVPYMFHPGEVVRFRVFEKKGCHRTVLQKDTIIVGDEAVESVEIVLTKKETEIGEIISKPKDYWYEIELNPNYNPQTIVGYDYDGPKVFRLFPEGADVEGGVGETPDNYVPAIGGYLPYVTEADNGKSVAVVDGEWKLADAITVDDTLNLSSTNPVTNREVALNFVDVRSEMNELDVKIDQNKVTVDDKLDLYSANPVQNKVVADEIVKMTANVQKAQVAAKPEMFGAKGDGVTDDTTAIQAALDCGGTIVFAPKTYLVNVVNMNTRLWVRSNSHIIFPVGCTIKLNTSPIHDYRVLNLSGVENVCISGGGRIVGDSDTHEGHYGQAGHGIGVTASKNVVIDGIEISHCWGDCIFINDNTAIRSSNVTVQNCTLHDTRRSGIAVCGCDGFKSANNVIYNITGDPEAVDADGKSEPLLGYGIDFEAHSNLGNDNCDVFDTRIYDCTPMGITLGGVNGKVNIRNSDVMDVRVGDSVGALLLDWCVLGRLRLVAIAGLDNVQVHKCTIGGAEINIESPDVEFHKCDFVPMGDAEMSVKFLSTGESTKTKRLNHATFDGCYFRTRHNNASLKKDAMFLFSKEPLDTLTITNCVMEVYNQIGLTITAKNKVTFTNNTVKQAHARTGGEYQCILNFQTLQGDDSVIVFANNTVDLKGVSNYYYKSAEAMRLFAATVYMLGNLFESTYTVTSTDSATGKKYGLSAVLCKMAGAYNTKKAVVANNTVDGLFATHFVYPTTEGFVKKESNNLLLCEE